MNNKILPAIGFSNVDMFWVEWDILERISTN